MKTYVELLTEALKKEFSFLAGDEDSWSKAATGILNKVNESLSEPKQDEKDYTVTEVHIIDNMLASMGWDYRKQTRMDFLQDLQKELANRRKSSEPPPERG